MGSITDFEQKLLKEHSEGFRQAMTTKRAYESVQDVAASLFPLKPSDEMAMTNSYTDVICNRLNVVRKRLREVGHVEWYRFNDMRRCRFGVTLKLDVRETGHECSISLLLSAGQCDLDKARFVVVVGSHGEDPTIFEQEFEAHFYQRPPFDLTLDGPIVNFIEASLADGVGECIRRINRLLTAERL